MSTLLTLKRLSFEALLGFLLYKINAKQLVQQPCNLFTLLSLPLNSFCHLCSFDTKIIFIADIPPSTPASCLKLSGTKQKIESLGFRLQTIIMAWWDF